MKKEYFVPLLAVLLAVSLMFAGCTQPAPAPTPEPTPEEPLKVKDVPELQDLVALGTIDPELIINPYDGLAFKPDGTPFKFAATYHFLGADAMYNAEGYIHSLVERSGATYTFFNAQEDSAKQVSYIEDLAASGDADGLVLQPIDEHVLGPVCEKAEAAGLRIAIGI